MKTSNLYKCTPCGVQALDENIGPFKMYFLGCTSFRTFERSDIEQCAFLLHQHAMSTSNQCKCTFSTEQSLEEATGAVLSPALVGAHHAHLLSGIIPLQQARKASAESLCCQVIVERLY